MAVELVIKISDSFYHRLIDMNIDNDTCSFNESALVEVIQNGTPLPKGHGRLIDEQSISDYVHSHIQEINTGYGDLNNHTNRILRMIESYIDNAPTIIKADKEDK